MNGFSSTGSSRKTPVGEHVIGGESPRPRKIAPWAWWKDAKAWTPWNWQEKTDQYQTFRKTKSEF